MGFQANLTENAYLAIRDRILRGDLPFGAGLSRRALAEEMGVSIVPVGDALQRLESDGLVESRPRVGTRVRVPTARGIRGHYILREALEVQAARLFAEKSSPAEREEIRRSASQLDQMHRSAPTSGDAGREWLYEIHKFHMRFHMRIAECTGCDELCQAMEKNQALIFNWLYDTKVGGQQLPDGWHGELAESLASGDPQTADAAMRLHTCYRMDELLDRMAPYFEEARARLAIFPKRPRRKGLRRQGTAV